MIINERPLSSLYNPHARQLGKEGKCSFPKVILLLTVLEPTGVPVTGGPAVSWTSNFSSFPCIFHYKFEAGSINCCPVGVCTLDGSPSISKQTNHLNSWNSSRIQDCLKIKKGRQNWKRALKSCKMENSPCCHNMLAVTWISHCQNRRKSIYIVY